MCFDFCAEPCGDVACVQGESEATTSFLAQLSTWHKEELDEKLASRVQVDFEPVPYLHVY
jgi:hypothetical protein